VVQKRESLTLGAQFQNAVCEVAAVCRSIELPISGDHEDVAVFIRGRSAQGLALPDCTIRRIGRRVEDRFLLDDWLNIQEYLVKVLRTSFRVISAGFSGLRRIS